MPLKTGEGGMSIYEVYSIYVYGYPPFYFVGNDLCVNLQCLLTAFYFIYVV